MTTPSRSHNLGIAGAKLVLPGAPETSLVSVRMHALDVGRMPALATSVVDANGTGLVDDFIRSLAGRE